MKDRIVEILQYTLKKDSGSDFHQIMHEVSVPLHTRNGIDVVAYGKSLHDADSYYLIRAFEIKSVLNDFYASAGWRSGPREAIISRIEVSLKSVLVLPQIAVNELRKK
ncbi:NIPSNAP family protein [Cronobacter dublinensis]